MAEQNFSTATAPTQLRGQTGETVRRGCHHRSITTFGNETKNVAWASGQRARRFWPGASHKKSKAIVALTARLIDVLAKSWQGRKAAVNPRESTSFWVEAVTGRVWAGNVDSQQRLPEHNHWRSRGAAVTRLAP
jgi:hypothetical protein